MLDIPGTETAVMPTAAVATGAMGPAEPEEPEVGGATGGRVERARRDPFSWRHPEGQRGCRGSRQWLQVALKKSAEDEGSGTYADYADLACEASKLNSVPIRRHCESAPERNRKAGERWAMRGGCMRGVCGIYAQCMRSVCGACGVYAECMRVDAQRGRWMRGDAVSVGVSRDAGVQSAHICAGQVAEGHQAALGGISECMHRRCAHSAHTVQHA
ncbi:uncharacterized protein T551_01355 [Pneumocystis jirovecii RU7]|uniref:Uncharacterized protein n=1 Tax=Pneumocystis jirovecii (strain RU7) TaxID=1408657 RepID=A0A0W4ZSE4_PNEJ7|nr:uncharacterized protein T551_01355 [Pneumocystis jirovecii RU7]KTW31283.1 hypothetical protein T551_01355 [Pneumocystis jirovecii RU7]